MDEQPRPWETAGACANVTLGANGLILVMEPENPNPATYEWPIAEIGRLGPAIASPFQYESLGRWLIEYLSDTSAIATWRVIAANGSAFGVDVADGTARVVRLAVSDVNSVSQFRHDVRNLVNAIGMNADLAGVLGGSAGDQTIKDAADRIRRSIDKLITLVSNWTAELDSSGGGRGIPVVVAVTEALRRVGMAVSFDDASIDDTVRASISWYFAAHRLLLEWAVWATRSNPVHVAITPDSEQVVKLECSHDAVGLSCGGIKLPATRQVFELVPKNAATPELELIEPTWLLGGARVGFGSWQTHDAAGVCIGIPDLSDRSRDSDSGTPSHDK